MARKITIPVDDHNDGNTCSLYYTVRFKPSADADWTYLLQQQPIETGSPVFYGLIIENLEDDISYDYEITRHCCSGTTSIAATGTVTTTP